ncbi:hypothetical protein GGI10_005634, partial [Coemansia sp. RSA 2530]
AGRALVAWTEDSGTPFIGASAATAGPCRARGQDSMLTWLRGWQATPSRTA